MKFSIKLTDSATEDIDFFQKKDRRLIVSGIAQFLTEDANVETRRRKRLRPNSLCDGNYGLRIIGFSTTSNLMILSR